VRKICNFYFKGLKAQISRTRIKYKLKKSRGFAEEKNLTNLEMYYTGTGTVPVV